MKKLLLILLLLPSIASTADLNDTVRNVAETKMSIATKIYGKNVEVVYVATDKSCDAVSILWTPMRIENFRVCGGEIIARNSVSPAIDDDVIHAALSSIVNNAILYGQAQQDEGGYTFYARSLGDLSRDCKNIEVIASYQGDLIDWGVRRICGK
ncbi:MAG: hypothetical protein WC710_01895 [Gallionella sp.]|jgi:hypothetical protein